MKIPLSKIDQIFIGADAYPIEFVFRYEKGLNPELLYETLKLTFLDFSPLASTICFESKRNEWFFEPHHLNPYFEVREGLDRPLDSVKTMPDQPLLKVVLSQGEFEDQLGISMSHAIADGFSYFFFLDSWFSRITGKSFALPDHRRGELKSLIKKDSQEIVNSENFYQKTGLHWLKKISRAEIGEVNFFRKQYRPENLVPNSIPNSTLNLTPNSILNSTTSPTTNSNPNKAIVSVNAILSAYCLQDWLTMNIHKSENIHLGCAVDLRQRLGGVIGSNYFGNAICGAGRKWSMEEFAQLTMDNVALQIHQSVSAISLTQTQDLITTLDTIYKQEGDSVNEKIHIADPFGGILVTNLSRLPLKNLDCGAGVPKDFSILTKATNTIAVTKVFEDLFLNGCILKNNT